PLLSGRRWSLPPCGPTQPVSTATHPRINTSATAATDGTASARARHTRRARESSLLAFKVFKRDCEGSIRAVVGEDARERHPDHPNVEADGPMPDIVKVVGDTHFHFVDEIGFPTPSVDL